MYVLGDITITNIVIQSTRPDFLSNNILNPNHDLGVTGNLSGMCLRILRVSDVPTGISLKQINADIFPSIFTRLGFSSLKGKKCNF
jgi:hypothetical protein